MSFFEQSLCGRDGRLSPHLAKSSEPDLCRHAAHLISGTGERHGPVSRTPTSPPRGPRPLAPRAGADLIEQCDGRAQLHPGFGNLSLATQPASVGEVDACRRQRTGFGPCGEGTYTQVAAVPTRGAAPDAGRARGGRHTPRRRRSRLQPPVARRPVRGRVDGFAPTARRPVESTDTVVACISRQSSRRAITAAAAGWKYRIQGARRWRGVNAVIP
mgnify:CR=1 FL=1